MPVADNVHIQGGGGKHSQENMIEVMAYLFQQGIDTVSQIWSSPQESFMLVNFYICICFAVWLSLTKSPGYEIWE